MSKIKSNSSNSPFRQQSKVKFYHQSRFLFYINKLAPKIADDLRVLTQRCEELFGKFPIEVRTIDNSPALYFTYDEYLEQPKQWNEIAQAFCDGQEKQEKKLSLLLICLIFNCFSNSSGLK